MVSDTIRKKLVEQQDIPYRDFQAKLIPGFSPDNMIGIRTPALRKLAKEIAKMSEKAAFLTELPHLYFEENQLHAFLISETKDMDECLKEVERFLPFVDNWATCDQMTPKVFGKHKDALLPHIQNWIRSDHTYTVRFGIKMLMDHFLEDAFRPEYPKWVADIHSDAYYINMMIAWYFATALAKQYDAIVPYLQEKRLDPWTHNKTIQKAIESYRIQEEQKQYLRGLKIMTRRTEA